MSANQNKILPMEPPEAPEVSETPELFSPDQLRLRTAVPQPDRTLRPAAALASEGARAPRPDPEQRPDPEPRPDLAPRQDGSPNNAPAAAAPPQKGSISARAIAARGGPAGNADYLECLNPQQADAVTSLDGPLLVLAGAGTGKTRVLTTRIAHILATGAASSYQILAVTFTNKAAREMKQRIGSLTGDAVEGMPWLGTFHSICVKILRRHAELVGLKSGFTILDMDDQLRLIKQVIEAAGIDKERWPARQFAGLMDGWKNKGLTPDKVNAGNGGGFAGGKGRELYAAYQKRLKELNAADFGDLLLECLGLFQRHQDVLEKYQNRFRYMLVDEYQDTNVVQYLWLRLLAQGRAEARPNLCCVGDDDQSIYGWRGAEVDNILRFDKDFPEAKVIRLERNYRSTGHILAAAAKLIAHNEGRLGKTLHTEDEAGEKVTVTGVWDDEEEARSICNDIENFQTKGHELNEIAILLRSSAQMRAFEDRFMTLGLPYRVIGGPRFYERQEIKDAIAYLEVTHNPANDLKFERIVNVPKRGLGDVTVKLIHAHAKACQMPMALAARELIETQELKPRARRPLSDLMEMFERWRGQIEHLPHWELAELILDDSGYTQMWQKDKSPQAQTRLENLKELVRFMHQFDSLGGFLEHVSLVMDTETGNDGDRISLMTLHAAKGLEFDTVFLSGWKEGLFPHQRSLDENGMAGLEEERRLAYVGITRAKKRAKISFAQNRRTHGLYQSARPSRFVDELPEQAVDIVQSNSPYGGSYGGGGYGGGSHGRGSHGGGTGSRFDGMATSFANDYDTPGWQRAKQQQTRWQQQSSGSGSGSSGSGPAKFQQGSANRRPARAHSRGTVIEGRAVARSSAASSQYKAGERVFHDKFGYGLIASVDGSKLTIDFDKAGRKRVVDSFIERH